MSRNKLYTILVVTMTAAALWQAALIAAQVEPGETDLFVPLHTIGQNRPSGIRYDPNFDRFAWVDAQGQLLIVDATTLETLRLIYPSGAYEAFAFSRDGHSLAVAVGVRIEVWDVDAGTLVAQFEPPGANRVQGPLQFTRNDELLVFDTVVPAPQELRRSENDTIILPWVWDVAAARDQRRSVLANRVEAYPFYSTRVSVLAGENGVLVTGLSNRIQIFDADTPTMEMIADLPAERLETDPIIAWRSATDPLLYVSLNRFGEVLQINTVTNETFTLELGYDLSLHDLEQLGRTPISRVRRVIGDSSNQINPLTQLLLGSDYVAQRSYVPTSLTLLDVLVPLTDDPLGSAAGNTSLLFYDFNEQYGIGAVDLLHPGDVGQIALNPNTTQLAIRRGAGQVELYNVENGALERILTPAEPDPETRRTFAYSADGRTLVIDFERFDTETGAQLAREERYTQPFSAYVFNDENQLITLGGTWLRTGSGGSTIWRLWDIGTGQLLREDSFVVNGEIMRVSDDNLRYLTRTTTPEGAIELTIVDGHAGEAQTFGIPQLANANLVNVIPNADWTRFIVVYETSDPATGGALYPVAVYTRAGEQLYFDAGNNLPSGAFSYAWRDDRTIAISTYPEAGVPPAPIMGLDYHPSGLPQCMVDAMPDQWQTLIPLWERVVYENSRDRVNAITQKICTALTGEGAQSVDAAQGTPAITPEPTSVVAMLTPTRPFNYQSGRTPAPIALPGVPGCITAFYQREAIAYADLWREITTGVTDAQQLAELEEMICEGLISNLGRVEPTPTLNPDTLIVTTPTPMEAAPVTTGGNENALDVMTIDVETGARTFATNFVLIPEAQRPDTAALLGDLFNTQYGIYPDTPIVSHDGRYMAARTDAGFVAIFRLSRTVDELEQDEQNAIATRAAQGARSVGLVPTATAFPQGLNEALPTLTPTMTVTPIPLTEAEPDLAQWGDTEFVCPARTLADVSTPGDDFNPPGTLVVYPIDIAIAASGGSGVWTLDPRTGALVINNQLPPCDGGNCDISPDGAWMVRQQQTPGADVGDIIVSRLDGSDAITLYTATDVQVISPTFRWREPHTLEISYNGVMPTLSPNPVSLIRTFDPVTGERSSETIPPTMEPLGLLRFDRISRQPYGRLEVLGEYFPGGTRYYLRDTTTGESEIFAQGDLYATWQPSGRFMYYESGGPEFFYDAQTGLHSRIDTLPDGIWSPNGRLRANWTYVPNNEIVQTLMQGELPPHLQVWDSETGLLRTYCLPETNGMDYSGTPFVWSPDSRYVAFTINLPIGGDVVPTPTFAISPAAPVPTATPIPLETQYDYQFPRTILLDTESGSLTVISIEISAIQRWMGE